MYTMLIRKRPKKSIWSTMIFISRMQWTNDSNVLSAQVLNRHQRLWIYYLLMEQLEWQK
jgi:hypothetical protein